MHQPPTDCDTRAPLSLSRREMLHRAGLGFGSLALAHLLAEDNLLSAAEGKPETFPLKPSGGKARSVIFLFMGGGPSHVDTFDPKPELRKLNGKDVPASIAADIPRVARAAPAQPVCLPLQVHAQRPQRHRRLGNLSRGRQVHRRPLRAARLPSRQPHSRAGGVPRHHRHAGWRPSQPGRLAVLWPGQSQSQPAGLRRLSDRRQRPAGGVVVGLPAGPLPGHGSRQGGHPQPGHAAGLYRQACAAPNSTCSAN